MDENNFFQVRDGDTVITLRVIEIDVPGDVWVIYAEYISEQDVPRKKKPDAPE